MSIRHAKISAIFPFLIVIILAGSAVADEPLPQRLQSDVEEDAELECFECSRGDLLTYDRATGKVTRSAPPPSGFTLESHLMTASGRGALVQPDDGGADKDFGNLHEVYYTTSGDYPKHVKIFAQYTDEDGHPVYSESSGTLIDPFHVLTAGHCVYKFDDVDDWAHTVWVVPAYDEGLEPFGRAQDVQLHSYAGWTENEDYDWDIAVIDLEWPIGALTGWRGYGFNTDCDWFTGPFWMHIAYPAADPYDGEIMYWQSGYFDGCESEGNEVWFDRDMYPGQSGGGGVKNDHVYTVHSNGTVVAPGDEDTYHVALTPTMYNDITGWIADDVPGAPDLMPLTITAPDTLVRGEYYTFDFLIHNYSSVAASGTWQVDIFASTNDGINGYDFELGSVTISATVNPKKTITKTVGFPAACNVIPGPHFLGIHLHAADVNAANDWTQPWHAAEIEIDAQPIAPIPDPYSPPDDSVCRERFDLPLLWSDSGPNCEYELQIGTSPGTGPVITTTTNYHTVTNLLAGTRYYWRVRAFRDCSFYWSSWSQDSWFDTEPDPNVITTVVTPADSVHCVQQPVTLEWTPLGGAESYDVRISPTWCYEGNILTDIQDTQVTLGTLEPNTTYYWAVRADTECGQTTTWSSAQQFCFTFKTAPLAVATPNLTVPIDGSTCESPDTGLLWSHAEDWDHYEVQVGTACETGPIHMTSYNGWAITGLESEVLYFWRVRTHHECGLVSDWTPCRSFSLDLVPPENPTTVYSTSHTIGVWSQDITMDTWWDFGSDACENAMVDYGFLFDNAPDSEPTVMTSEMPEFTYTTSGDLADGDDIWFHVRSVDQAGNWALDTLHLGPFWIDATQPSEMRLDRVCLPTGLWGDFGALMVSWEPATDLTSGVAGYSYVLTEDVSEPDTTVDITDEAVTLPFLYGVWMFRIVAVDAAGNTGRSAEIGPYLNDPSLPSFMIPTPCQEVLEGVVLPVQWEEVSRVNSGELLLSLNGGQTFARIATLTGAEVEGGLYDWLVPAETTDEAVLRLDVDAVAGVYSTASPLFMLQAVTDADDFVPEAELTNLMANYPNPFNPRTTIVYTLAAETRVCVTVLDALGHRVRTLVDWSRGGPGHHEVDWDGTNNQGQRVSSGVYFSCLETPHGREMRRMVLIK